MQPASLARPFASVRPVYTICLGLSMGVCLAVVQGDSRLDSRVWILDSDAMTVSSHPVEIGRMSGHLIEVTGGLKGGEEIVAVGAPYLAEGMKVTRMAQREQAVPRADDPA